MKGPLQTVLAVEMETGALRRRVQETCEQLKHRWNEDGVPTSEMEEKMTRIQAAVRSAYERPVQHWLQEKENLERHNAEQVEKLKTVYAQLKTDYDVKTREVSP